MSEVRLAQEFQTDINALKAEIGKAVIGQDEAVNGVLNTIFSNGHVLLLGVPGLAKTLLIRTISQVLDLSFNRIQFTPDLMPSDITGAEILDENRKFSFVKGPVFANIVLADEINRTPPKTQAALLEAMQEKEVSVAGKTMKLDLPFFVLATQNPIEQEGTYNLPEAQLDRFMFNIILDYPSAAEEKKIVTLTTGYNTAIINQIINKEKIIAYQDVIRKIPVAENVISYAVDLVGKTRNNKPTAADPVKKFIAYGAGPRASQYLVLGAKTHALMNGKLSPDIEDIQAIAKMVLRHRLVKNYKAEAEGISTDSIIEQLL
jgi:MoxR-like ATPase